MENSDPPNDIWNIFNSIKNNAKTLDTQIEETLSQNALLNFEIDFCSDCKTNTLIYDDGVYFCSKCGTFQRKLLSQTAEYRYYGDADNKTSNPERVGMPTNMLLPKSSLGSLIANTCWDKYNFRKMIQYNSWNAMPYKERSQWKVFSRIAAKSKSAGLPNIIIEDAKGYYKTISETSISRGSNRNGIIAACVYMACKKERVPRSSKEVADIFGIDLQDMTRGCKRFKEIWRIAKKKSKKRIRSSNPLDYIDRFCSNLHISCDLKHIAEYIAVKALSSKNDLVEDNTAPSIAAGSIFLVCSLCNQNITKKQVSKACKISEVTISKCYKKLYKEKKQLLPPTAIIKYNIKIE